MMDVVEVDPQLFVTCRLCVEDMGQYQIVPNVKQQIKYCFDIDVDPFDGLPQLICKKCKSTLSEFYATKKTYLEKQSELKLKVVKKEDPPKIDEPQQQTVSSSQQFVCESIKNCKPSKRKKRISQLSSSTSHDLDSDRSTITKLCSKKVKKEPQNVSSWESVYTKRFNCRFCEKYYKNKCSLKKHLSVHSDLLLHYHYILRKTCSVNLNKIDDKPNITGDAKAVVYSQNEIIYDENNSNYYIVYFKNEISKDVDVDSLTDSNTDKLIKRHVGSESDSDDNILIKRKQRRTKLLSESSNETMLIEGKSNKKSAVENENQENEVQSNDNVCINIDDSDTNSASAENLTESQEKAYNIPLKASENDYKTIKNIVSLCQNKYMKRSDIAENNVNPQEKATVKSHLKHKVLSIGRKVINNRTDFRCTGLLRYLEESNLNILWIPILSKGSTSKESNYVRIMTKLRDSEDNDSGGWKSLQEFTPEIGNIDEDNSCLDKTTNSVAEINVCEYPVISAETGVRECPINSTEIGESAEISESTTENVHVSAKLYINNTSIDSNCKNKLLNKTPVLNPKQLPRKNNTEDVKQSTSEHAQNSTRVYNGETVYINLDDDCNNGMLMPIITSTESLAPDVNKNKSNDSNNVSSNNMGCNTTVSNNTQQSEISLPRIKVKPVSELMPKSAVNNISQQVNNIWMVRENQIGMPYTIQGFNTVPVYVNIASKSQVVAPTSVRSPVSLSGTNVTSFSVPTNRDYVILDTVELPNTKTDSPFTYFKNLLQIHGIILLDTHEVSRAFSSLIKFKVQFVQDKKEVFLCLALLCAGNTFCILVKDVNQQAIDINKIPANWQWEILKSKQKPDVVNRILQSAQKISQEVHEYTKTYVFLLNSINFKTNI